MPDSKKPDADFGWRRPVEVWDQLKPLARGLRQDSTSAETALWERLRKNRVGGFAFRRQHAIGSYIADFCCPSVKLVVEVDGASHDGREEEDLRRTRFLESRGYRVLRLRNEEILADTDSVIDRILVAIESSQPDQSPHRP